MEKDTVNNCNIIKQIILSTNEPLLIKDQMNCALKSWNLKEWNKVLGSELLRFRCGKNQHTEQPQWEATCSVREAKFEDFLVNSSNEGEWWYFDYKYLCEWFTDKEVLKQKIDWSTLGFPEINSDSSTIWIGSKGAHTPCHMDTYGCNMVLQVFGRKLWLLFPPEQNLKPTRIPFEESSIYSKFNFFSPSLEQFKGVGRCQKVILEPGDVLVVPNKWWHYVENLETAISINAWLPLPQDDFQRIKESIATLFVRKITQSQPELQNIVLNPNMAEEMINSDEALNIIGTLKDKCKTKNKIQKTGEKLLKNQNANLDLEQLVSHCRNICKIPVLDDSEFKAFLTSQAERFSKPKEYHSSKQSINCRKILDFLEVVIDDEVLDLITRKLINKS